jgi:RimJ/RimL family protein N-acetyltransferase
MPTIETERLILRDVVPSDWEALNAFLSDPSVTRYMHFSSWDDEIRMSSQLAKKELPKEGNR